MTQPIRVTHIIKVVLVAGAERHLLTLLPALRERNVEPSILLLVAPDKPMNDFMALAQARDIPIVREIIHRHADPSLVPRMSARLRELRPDVVHTHLLHADLYGVPVARALGIRVVTSRHNDNAFRRRLPMRLLHRGLWGMTHQGIAISNAIRQFCIDVEGINPNKITTVYYGVESDSLAQDVPAARAALRAELGLRDDALIVGTMCRLIEQKGLTYGLQAFAQIMANHPAAHLVITGDGVLRAELEAEAHTFGLGERVHFMGWRDNPAHVLAGYDLLLMPSLWEGFGLVMLEAMAQGIPIIGSDVSAIPEVIVHNETGLLAPPRDVDVLAKAMHTLLNDPQQRAQMGAAARARLNTHFNAGRMADETRAVYDRASS